jgi:hypothetical protein
VFLVGLSLGVPRRSVSYVDRFLVVSAKVVLSRQLLWLLVRPCLAEHRSDNISRPALPQPHRSM